jgi:hypothetical protein
VTIPWFFATITSSRILARAHSSFATVTGSRILARTARFLREVARLIFQSPFERAYFLVLRAYREEARNGLNASAVALLVILVTWASHNYRFVRVSFVEWLNTFQSPCATIPWFPVAMRGYSLVLQRDYFLVFRDDHLFSILARTHSIFSWFGRPVTCSHWLRAPRSHRHQL